MYNNKSVICCIRCHPVSWLYSDLIILSSRLLALCATVLLAEQQWWRPLSSRPTGGAGGWQWRQLLKTCCVRLFCWAGALCWSCCKGKVSTPTCAQVTSVPLNLNLLFGVLETNGELSMQHDSSELKSVCFLACPLSHAWIPPTYTQTEIYWLWTTWSENCWFVFEHFYHSSFINSHYSFLQWMSQWSCLWATPPVVRRESGSNVWNRKRCWIWASPLAPSCSAPPPCRSVYWWTSLGHDHFAWWAGNGWFVRERVYLWGLHLHVPQGEMCLFNRYTLNARKSRIEFFCWHFQVSFNVQLNNKEGKLQFYYDNIF